MTNCPKCETNRKAGKSFCTACGAALAPPAPAPTPASAPPAAPAPKIKAGPPPVPSPHRDKAGDDVPEAWKRSWRWVRIVLPVVLLVCALAIIFFAGTVLIAEGPLDFRDDEVVTCWVLILLGLAGASGAVLLLRRGRSRRP
jgi:hypothetical protein